MTPIRQLANLDPSFAWDGARLYRETDLAEDVPGGLRGAASFAGRPGPGGAGFQHSVTQITAYR